MRLALWIPVLLGSGVVLSAFAGTAAADETGMASLHAWRKEGGRTCMVDHFHYGSSAGASSRQAAMKQAVASWASFTALEYGTTWARFSRSAGKKVNCGKSGGSWECSIESRPCR